MTDKKKFNRIKVVLAEKEMTNADLAKALNVNQATVSRWCTNDTQPSIETLFEIAKILEVDAPKLLRD
ncbi:helix-turn-helix transcriptional regulator [Ekhidna sp.]